MHGRFELPEARTFYNDIVAWIVLFVLCGLIYLGYCYWERGMVVDTTHNVSKTNNPLLLVLTYGRITKSGDGKFISQAQLKEHLHAIRDQGFAPISIEEVKNFYHEGMPLPAKSVLLLFEHGFLSTYENVDPVLRDMRWRATMAISTQRIQERNTTFLYWDRLQRMLNSRIWDIASAGHAGYDAISIDHQAEAGQALFHKRWLSDQGRQENDTQFRRRIHWDYAYSKNLMEKRLTGLTAQAYVLPFGDLSKLTNDPLILRTNQQALTSYYLLGFVDNEFGTNDRSSNPFQLNRRRMTPDWSTQRLTQHMLAILENPITTGQLEVASTDWVVGVGNAEQHEDRILLSGEHRADMWVPGGQWTEFWKVEAGVRVEGDQQFWIVQYDDQTPGAFWRWGGDAHTLTLQYSPNGGKVETLRSFIKPMNTGEYHRVALNKRGQGIWVEWDNEPLSEHPVYLPGEWRGKVGWVAWNETGRSQLELRQPKITLFPLQIQTVNSYPSRGEVQLLTKRASQLGALAVPRWRFEKGQFNSLEADDDLLRFITHRYGWKLIPTICITPSGIHNPTWDGELNQFIQSLPNRQVHLDLTHVTDKIKLGTISRIREKFASFNRKLWLTGPSNSSVHPQRGSCDSVLDSYISSFSKQSAPST